MRAQLAGSRCIDGADVEMRLLPTVAHQERAALFKPSVQVHYRDSLSLLGNDAIARLQDNAADRDHAQVRNDSGALRRPKRARISREPRRVTRKARLSRSWTSHFRFKATARSAAPSPPPM